MPGGRSAGRGCSLRSRRQHGLDDQPLHGQPQGAQTTTPIRPAGRSVGGPIVRHWPIASGPARHITGVPVIAGGVEATSAANCPLRLLERQSPRLDHARLQGRPCGLRHGRDGRSSKSRIGCAAGARRFATYAICAAWLSVRGEGGRAGVGREPRRQGGGDKESGRGGRTAHHSSLIIRQLLVIRFSYPITTPYRDDSLAFCETTRIIHNETNPYNAKRLVQYHGPASRGGQSAGISAGAGRNGSRLRPAVHAPAASELRRARSPRTR